MGFKERAVGRWGAKNLCVGRERGERGVRCAECVCVRVRQSVYICMRAYVCQEEFARRESEEEERKREKKSSDKELRPCDSLSREPCWRKEKKKTKKEPTPESPAHAREEESILYTGGGEGGGKPCRDPMSGCDLRASGAQALRARRHHVC